MNDTFRLPLAFVPVTAAPRAWRFHLLAGLMLILGWAGCADRDAVKVRLHSAVPNNRQALHLEIEALVTGPQVGLRYKWYSISGSCTPQESDSPNTVFRFAEGVARDRVSVEVWRGEKRVAESAINVNFEGELAKRMEAETHAEVYIEITTVPPREAGGDASRADIAGKVSGKVLPEHRVVIYARAYDNWYIQPTVQAMHPILPDNSWSTWTHTGDTYAVFVVRSGYVPLVRMDVLPQVGGYIVARKTVEGR